MFSKLFHKDVFIPDNVQETVIYYQKHFNGYFLTNHLKEHLSGIADRSHNYVESALYKCLNTIKNRPQEAFEVELSKDYHYFERSGWFVTKYCIRIPYNNVEDIVVSIRPQFNLQTKEFDFDKNMIVTAWMNKHTDNHYTLDDSKYCSKKEWEKIK